MLRVIAMKEACNAGGRAHLQPEDAECLVRGRLQRLPDGRGDGAQLRANHTVCLLCMWAEVSIWKVGKLVDTTVNASAER